MGLLGGGALALVFRRLSGQEVGAVFLRAMKSRASFCGDSRDMRRVCSHVGDQAGQRHRCQHPALRRGPAPAPSFRFAGKPSFREASCCSVEVVKGGAGLRRRSLRRTLLT